MNYFSFQICQKAKKKTLNSMVRDCVYINLLLNRIVHLIYLDTSLINNRIAILLMGIGVSGVGRVQGVGLMSWVNTRPMV